MVGGVKWRVSRAFAPRSAAVGSAAGAAAHAVRIVTTAPVNFHAFIP